MPSAPTDFIDGLVTLGGAGSARLRRGYAVHLYAANRNMEDRAFYDADGDLLLLPQHGALTLLTELGPLMVKPGELALVPRGLRFSVMLAESTARGYVAEVFGPPLRAAGARAARLERPGGTPATSALRGVARDRLAPGYRITAKMGGSLHQTTQDWSPYDVVAWHGNHCPYVYDLSLFTPRGLHAHRPPRSVDLHRLERAARRARLEHARSRRIPAALGRDRGHPSACPTSHRNATTEINGIVREVTSEHSMFVPGCTFITPSLTPHGPVAAASSATSTKTPSSPDCPHRYSESALWFQFETTLPLSLTRGPKPPPNGQRDWHANGASTAAVSRRIASESGAEEAPRAESERGWAVVAPPLVAG